MFSFIFSCSSKFVGEYCEHPNQCHSRPRCQNGGTCVVGYKEDDGTPKFTCKCPIGFTASLCEIREKNVCDSSPCQHGGTCSLKSLEEYTCSCAQGYTGKNIFFHTVKCLVQMKYQQNFNLGFSFFMCNLGKHCEKQNLCASSPCRNGGTCTSLPQGNFKCSCPKGYKGATCSEDVEECQSNPCRHGGTCVNTHGSYQ